MVALKTAGSDKRQTNMVDVTVPAGTKLEFSLAGPQQNFGMQGGGQQIRIVGKTGVRLQLNSKSIK